MNEVNIYTGSRIRMYRKSRGLTLQQLADKIHKSRASVSKYETGEISLDLETLFEIAGALGVSTAQLLDEGPRVSEQEEAFSVQLLSEGMAMSPFYKARRLFFYFYDGRCGCLKDGIIDIRENREKEGFFEAALSVSSIMASGRSSQVYYTGRVVYSHMLIRFSFVNQCNALEEDLLYIFNPLELRDSTQGLLCGISSSDLMPCAFKCLVTLSQREHTEELVNQLLITKSELQRWQKMNMLIVDNRSL